MIAINGVAQTRIELATHDTDLKADIGDYSGQTNLQTLEAALGIPETAGKSLYVCIITDRLDDGTIGLSKIATDLAAALVDTNSAGIVLGTKVAAYKKLVGEQQIATTTQDLNNVAAAYDLFTGTDAAVLLTRLSIKMPDDIATAPLESIAIATEDATPGVIIKAEDGALEFLIAEAEITWSGAMVINVGTKIQLTIAGDAEGEAYVTTITAKYESIADGGSLA